MMKDPTELNNEGVQLCLQQRLREALECFDRAITLRPLYVEARCNRGILLDQLRLHQEAFEDLSLAVRLSYNDHELHNSLASALHHLWRNEEALIEVDRALKIKPTHVLAHTNKAHIMESLKRYNEAIACHNRALQLDPGNWATAYHKVFLYDLIPGMTFEDHQRVRRECHEQQTAHIKPTFKHTRSADRHKRLTIGYLSGDFRDHSAAFGIRPILQNHDRGKFKIICYANNTIEDEVTLELKEYADVWRRTNSVKTDDDFAQLIYDDKVDILVDLAGHTADSRLRAMAQRPAPINVTAWGYSTGTGCPFVDYLFTDPVQIPQSVRHLYAEELFNLPCQFTYAPRPGLPDVSPELPYDRNGFITFSCFNRESKVSPEALRLWAKILRAIPSSRLRLKSDAYVSTKVQETILRPLVEEGIDAERVTFRKNHRFFEHMRSFDDVDVALDPFPHNGGISTWEPIWMGVPVICKIGNSHPSRISAAILSALDLGWYIGQSDDDYVDLAIHAANNPEIGRHFRKTIRDRLKKSTAGNPALYVREVEKAYREIWRRWCKGEIDARLNNRRETAKHSRRSDGADLRDANRSREAARPHG